MAPELSGLAAYSYFDESVPIAYVSEEPQCMYPISLSRACNDGIMHIGRFPYTAETYNNPQNLWLFAWVSSPAPARELLTNRLLREKQFFWLRWGISCVGFRKMLEDIGIML